MISSSSSSSSSCRSEEDNFDVIIVGAGIAGSAMAYALGSDGRKVLLIEKSMAEPNRIVGELLQPGGINALKRLGLQNCVEDIDSPEVHGYAVVKADGECVPLKYPKDKNGGDTIGHSFHHGRFVMQLRKEAIKAPNVTIVEAVVNNLIFDDERVVGVNYTETKAKKSAKAELTIICDGCHSGLRTKFIDTEVKVSSYFWGLILKDCELPHPNHGHVFLAEPAPILAYQLDTHETRVLVDIPVTVRESMKSDVKTYLANVTAPQLPKKVREAFLQSLKEGNLKSMPNKRLHTSPHFRAGAILLGDAFNMRHPLTGAGMTVALWDVVHIRELLRTIKSDDFQNEQIMSDLQKNWFKKRRSMVSTVNILAHALYSLFAARDERLIPMRNACFEYFKKGGKCADEPMRLLSITNAQPSILIMHFFLVALYGTFLILKSNYFAPTSFYSALLVLWLAAGIILPLMRDEHIFSFSYPSYTTLPSSSSTSSSSTSSSSVEKE